MGQSPDVKARARKAGDQAAVTTEAKARRAFAWYRTMAIITGIMLLVLVAEMVMKYVFTVNGVAEPGNRWSAEPILGAWVAILHGWIYVVYLVTAVNLWSLMRWSAGRLISMVLAGVIPVMSFILERRVATWFDADLPQVVGRARTIAERSTTLAK